jgi:hypothetical protein
VETHQFLSNFLIIGNIAEREGDYHKGKEGPPFLSLELVYGYVGGKEVGE